MDIEKHTIFLARVGSFSYGTNIEGSDIDLRGCLVAPLRSYCDPYFTFEQHEEQVAKGFPTDKVVYDIKKFIKLAAQANPNSLEPLFVEPQFIEKITTVGQTLLDNRHLFISQEFKSRIFGFATRELEELRRDFYRANYQCAGYEEQKVLEERFQRKSGKRSLHVRRLMNMLFDFYQKEMIIVFRPEAKELNEERTKDWFDQKNLTDLGNFFAKRELDINELAAKSPIPLKPDYEKISDLCYRLIDDAQYDQTREMHKRIKMKLGAQ